MIEVKGLVKTYGTQRAVDGVSFKVNRGKPTLVWTTPFTNGGSPILNYIIEVSRDGTVWTLLQTATGKSAALRDYGTNLLVRVRAVTAGGTGVPSKAIPLQ